MILIFFFSSAPPNVEEISEREETSTGDDVDHNVMESEMNEMFTQNRQNQSPPPKKPKKDPSQEEQLLINLNRILNHTNEELFDDNKHFLLSLLPELKKVPEDAKLECRMAIMSTISRFRAGPHGQSGKIFTVSPLLQNGEPYSPISVTSPPPSHYRPFSNSTSYSGNTSLDVYPSSSQKHYERTELSTDGESTETSDSTVKQEPSGVIIS